MIYENDFPLNASGVYIIRNITNDKCYVGSAVNFRKRFHVHKTTLNRNTHKNPHLQSSWNKYGKDSFVYEIEEIVNDLSKLIEREQYWIDKLDACKTGYNIQPTAGSSLGRKLSDEVKRKLALKTIGRVHKEETKQKMSLHHRGNLNGMYGKTHTEDAKRRMSHCADGTKSEKYKGDGNPFYGKHHTQDTKNKIGIKNKGKIVRSKLTLEEVKELKRRLHNKPNDVSWNAYYEQLAPEFNMSASGISKIKNLKRWKDVQID